MRRSPISPWLGSALLALGTVSLSACPAEDTPPEDKIDGAYYHYVGDTLLVPTTPAEAQAYALNLDGDPQGRPDNLLGQLLATLAGQDVSIQDNIDASIMAGKLVILHSLRANSLTTDASVSWQVFLGEDLASPPPDFSGNGAFEIAADSPTDAVITGALAGGRFLGGPSVVTVKIALADNAPPLNLDLIGSRIEADMAPDGTTCSNARLGGAITQVDINTKVLPSVAMMMNATVAADEGCPAACVSDSAKTILELFDTQPEGGDGTITPEELIANNLISSILAPDVDLLDSNNGDIFDPRRDGIEDSVSLGVAFSCVKANFSPANEAQ